LYLWEFTFADSSHSGIGPAVKICSLKSETGQRLLKQASFWRNWV